MSRIGQHEHDAKWDSLIPLESNAEAVYSKAFDTPRDPRSIAYKNGVRAALAFRINGTEIPHPYVPGTAEDDAYYAGTQEGHALWRSHNCPTEGKTP